MLSAHGKSVLILYIPGSWLIIPYQNYKSLQYRYIDFQRRSSQSGQPPQSSRKISDVVALDPLPCAVNGIRILPRSVRESFCALVEGILEWGDLVTYPDEHKGRDLLPQSNLTTKQLRRA